MLPIPLNAVHERLMTVLCDLASAFLNHSSCIVATVCPEQKVVGWAGLLLQAAPEAVHSQRALPEGGGVYASYRFFGSPASRHDLAPTANIVEVDATPTPTLEAFLECTRNKRDGEVLRVKHIDLEGRCRMTTIKLDLKYWPTYLLERDVASGEWERRGL